jgi:glutamyl-tRNA reductase
VQGQARAAYAEALNAKSIGPVLAALGRAAIHAGKRVRTETLIAHSGQSIAEIAVESVAGNSRFLVLGAGRVAVDVLAELKAAGAGSVVVAARRQDRAKVLGDRHCAAVGPWQELAVAIRQADAVLACTAAEEYVLGLDDVTSRVTSPLTVIDLGVPRNVDPRVGRLSGVRLIHLDELTPTGGASLDELRAAEAIVSEELERFFTWLRGHAAAPVIRRLLGRSGRALDRGVLHRRIVRIKEQIAA